jgi:hypothetical protein
MASVASRTPSGHTKVESNKYMPDYGGILEVPGTKTKQNGLKVGIPFDMNPYYVRIVSDTEQRVSPEPRGPDCLLAVSYLNADGYDDLYSSEFSFSTIRAVGKTLSLDLVKSIPCQPTAPEIHQYTTYGHVPYSYNITGLKYCDNVDNYVIVKFAQGVKLIKLNKLYRMPPEIQFDSTNCESDSETEVDEDNRIPMPDQSALTSIDSFAEKPGAQVKDATMSINQDWLYIASSDERNLYVKLYDLSTSKQCYNILTKTRDDDVKIRVDESKRKQSLRSFIPSKPSFEELQQIVCDPSHLINSLMITSNSIGLVDPRESSISIYYADKFKMLSTSPTERFKQIEFSHFNDNQFYLMSDEKLRALDKRYPSKDMNIMNHMLDTADYDVMTMKLAAMERSEQETLCLSVYGHICIFSFDQSQFTHSLISSAGKLINPRSLHKPVHEPSPTSISGKVSDELYGLALTSKTMIFDSKDIMFSILQLSQEGDVCVRGFLTPRDNFLNFESCSTRRSTRPGQPKTNPDQEPSQRSELEETDNYAVQNPTDSQHSQLNILEADCIIEAEKQLTKRAKQRYDWMKKKLRRHT